MKTEQPTQKNIVVTGKSQTGSAFGIVIGTGEGCFIPVAVASAGGAQAGSIYLAECILNPNELSHNNTPLMCVKLNASDGILSDDPPASNPSISSARRFTNEIMQTGVWTSDEVFCEFMGSGMAITQMSTLPSMTNLCGCLTPAIALNLLCTKAQNKNRAPRGTLAPATLNLAKWRIKNG